MTIDPLLILAFEIVGVTFLLGWFVAQIVREEADKQHQRWLAEEAFFLATMISHTQELDLTKE
jgi:hypothetical protein